MDVLASADSLSRDGNRDVQQSTFSLLMFLLEEFSSRI